jgi:hypothetical protein
MITIIATTEWIFIFRSFLIAWKIPEIAKVKE